ncbi:MAG: Gfo/Idh/MocA family protein, partial [Phycisphaeraceae bacterium]
VGVELVALAEAVPELLEHAKGVAPDATGYSDYHEMLADEKVDAVAICLPTGMHAKAAVDAFNAGKHVYLEKPIGITMQEAAEVTAAEAASGKTGMIGFNFRFHPVHQELKRRIESGAVGNVVAVRSAFCVAKHDIPKWKQMRETGGGVLLDLGTHHIDQARFLFGQPIASVSAGVRAMTHEGDTASLRMTLGNGVIWDGLFSYQASDCDTIEVVGDAGMLKLDRYAGTLENAQAKPGAGVGKRVKAAIGDAAGLVGQVMKGGGEPSFENALTAWAEAMNTTGKPPVTLNEAMNNLAVVCAAERSAESSGAPIDPADLIREVSESVVGAA